VGKTNLCRRDEGQEDTRSRTSGSPQSNEDQRIHSIKGRRLNEHGDNGLVQSAHSGWRPDGSTDAPVVQDEPDDDHEGEEDVEQN